MLPIAVHKVLSQLKKGVASLLNFAPVQTKQMEFIIGAAAKLEMHVKYRTQITLSTPELFVACQVKWEGQKGGCIGLQFALYDMQPPIN